MNEDKIHAQVCAYIRLQYPKALFNSDLSGIKLTMGQSVKVKNLRSGRGFPDLVIYERRGSYAACFIELKADGVKLWKRNGDWANAHLREQADMISELIDRGYFASFAVGFDEAKRLIDGYMAL